MPQPHRFRSGVVIATTLALLLVTGRPTAAYAISAKAVAEIRPVWISIEGSPVLIGCRAKSKHRYTLYVLRGNSWRSFSRSALRSLSPAMKTMSSKSYKAASAMATAVCAAPIVPPTPVVVPTDSPTPPPTPAPTSPPDPDPSPIPSPTATPVPSATPAPAPTGLTKADCELAFATAFNYAATEDASNPHPTDHSKHVEHLAMLAVASPSFASDIAVHSGSWGDTANVWCHRKDDGSVQPSVLPGNGASIWIMPQVSVLLDRDLSAVAFHMLRVTGTLTMSTSVSTAVRSATIFVDPSGAWVQGPIPRGLRSNVIIADEGPINRVEDPYALGRGFIAHGTTTIEGAETTSYASYTAPHGSVSQIALDSAPVNWQVGQPVIFASPNWSDTTENWRTITAINGNVLTVDRPLPDWSRYVPNPSLKLHVGYTTRNVKFSSESVADQQSIGHVMFMHSPKVSVKYAQFDSLGRTDKIHQIVNDAQVDQNNTLVPGTGTNPRGRYALHFHRTVADINSVPALVKGCSVTQPHSWGAVNHDSNVDFEDNIIVDAKGAAFVTEIGTEVGHFWRNMVVNVESDANASANHAAEQAVLDWGRSGSGYWLASPATEIDGGVMADLKTDIGIGAIEIFGWRTTAIDPVTGQLTGTQFPAAQLDPAIRTQVAGTRSWVWHSEVPFTVKNLNAYSIRIFLAQHANTGGVLNLIDNCSLFTSLDAYDNQYSTGVTIRDSKFYGGLGDGTGMGNDWQTEVDVENTTFQGYRTGIFVPQNGNTLLRNVHLSNDRINLSLARVDLYQYTEAAFVPRQNIVVENATFAGDGNASWIDLMVPSQQAIPHAAWLDYSLGTWIPGILTRRIQSMFKPANIVVNGKQVYSDDQRADFQIYATGEPELDGHTNAELTASCGLAIMDQIMPSNIAALPIPQDGIFVDGDGLRLWGGKTGPLNPNPKHVLTGSLNIYQRPFHLKMLDQNDNNRVVYEGDLSGATSGQQKVVCGVLSSGSEIGRKFGWISDTLP